MIEFILYCYTKSGGFARTPNSAAFLDSTFYAVESLTLLKF
ncbi:prenyltransferase/squalene oxidase repeat-containing protein [Thermodesulfovibrio sp. 3907-1M]